MAAGNRGPFAVLALVDRAGASGSVIEWTPRTGRHVVEELGEIDTGDPETLADFVARGLVTYPPGVKLAIGFWDHGTGVFAEQDPNERLLNRGRLGVATPIERPRSRPARRLLLGRRRAGVVRARATLHDDTNAGVLTNLEAGRMLAAAFARAGPASTACAALGRNADVPQGRRRASTSRTSGGACAVDASKSCCGIPPRP